jgi:hypothetical protein
MKYYIYARTLSDAQSLAQQRSWSPAEWGILVLDIDEPIARKIGVYDEV